MGTFNPNWLDAVILLALCVGLVVGFGQGLIRQVMAVFAFYVSTALSGQYYRIVASWISDLFPDASAIACNGVAMVSIFVVLLSVLIWIGYGIYPSTRIGSLAWLDQLGGATLGLIWAACLIGMGLMVASYAVTGFWAIWEGPRQGFDQLLARSDLLDPVMLVIPVVYQLVSPWLPNGLPLPLVAATTLN